MTAERPAILCPIDFSDASRASLHLGVAIANHFGATVTVLAVDDPLLAAVTDSIGPVPWLAEQTRNELQRFCDDTLGTPLAGPATLQFSVRVGKPAAEILHEADSVDADLIVMGSHGRSGVRKLFFGSTTERVLRESKVPVLVTPTERVAARTLDEVARYVNAVVVPVDLTGGSVHHATVAAGIARALGIPLLLAHVLEPIVVPLSIRAMMSAPDAVRRAEAGDAVELIRGGLDADVVSEALVLLGEPSEEIVKLADARGARLIVLSLHSSGLLGPRIGSVTYRVLCQTHAMVLALPPAASQTAKASSFTTATVV